MTLEDKTPVSAPRRTNAPSELSRQQRRSFILIAGTFIVLLLISIAASWAAIEVVNSTRAYSTGEGRYSKAEKIAVLSLHRYAYSQRNSDYDTFLAAIAVPRGDRAARLALEAPKVDTAVARDGFLRGENHKDDVDGLINLFRLARRWGPFDAAVADWTEGDSLVTDLVGYGEELNRRIAAGTLDPATRDRLLGGVDRVDDRLTSLENTFSTHMGEAARTATKLVVFGVGSIMILLWGIGMAFARRLLHRQMELAEHEAKELETANEQLVATALELETAREKAEKASGAKSAFLSNMSHELRTPLNSILGFAQLLELNAKDPLTSRQAGQVGHIRSSGEHLLSLIDDVLDLSKIEAGNINLTIEPVPLGPVLEQVHAALSPLADKAGIAMTVNVGGESLIARADRTRLLQVLMNLGNNAIKYSRSGGQLTMSAAATDSFVRLVVADTGLGIPLARQKEVFEAFNRLGAEHSAIEGTGIGLHLTQRLVHLMDGRIAFTSEPNVGTTFSVDLPAWTGQTSVYRDFRFSNIVDMNRHRQGYTLLYVEDNPSNVDLMRGVIEALDGVRLLTAPHPFVGLELAHTHVPDVIVMDIDLPDMNGFELLKKLKTSPSTMDIPVIALSAAAMSRDIERGIAAGFTHYLTKPMNVRKFLAAVDSVLAVPTRGRRRY